jgi:hypothetical protein
VQDGDENIFFHYMKLWKYLVKIKKSHRHPDSSLYFVIWQLVIIFFLIWLCHGHNISENWNILSNGFTTKKSWFFLQKIFHIEFCGHFQFLRKCFFIKKTDNKPNLINLKENFKKTNFQVLTNKNVLTTIWNLGAILNFHVWKYWFYFFVIKSIRIEKKIRHKWSTNNIRAFQKMGKKNSHFDLSAIRNF